MELSMEVKLYVADTLSAKKTVNYIIETYHSYVPTSKSVGRRLDWLISVDGEIVGMIGIGSATYPPCKDVLKKLNITKKEYKDIFNNIANNWRFCMTKSIKNAGTMVLKELRKQAPIEWKNRFGDELKYLVTFVGGNNNGAVYKADNWELIGETAGLPEHVSVSMKWDNSMELKEKFVKPSGENKKLIFFKKL